MKDEELADKYAEEYFGKKTELVEVWKLKSCKENFLAGLKAKKKQIEKVKYTLKKIIETVQNDRIDEYGARLVLIKDFAYECLEEIEK